VPGAPPPAVVLRRALRLRCPACGVGPVFLRGFRRASDCRSCGRRLDPDEGHWLGGSELVMGIAFGGGAAAALPLLLLVDPPAALLHGLAAAHLAASLALVRPCRSLFLALDYLVDPEAAPPAGPGRGPEPPGEPLPAPAPGPSGRTRPSRPRGRRGRRAARERQREPAPV
jgi:uncharacterized protein (DUF983 family)